MSKKSDHDTVAEAAGHLFGLVVRTRFRNPGTSSDPYMDSLLLWLSVVHEVREIIEPVAVRPEVTLDHVETIYRCGVKHWLAGDAPVDDPNPSDDYLTNDELIAALRDAIDPPDVWLP
ncbi:hypothetical protein [Mycolicibacterium brumae]|uniref:Uncharacterized protein n=1 Tax=Mycolicibacterium brumae TaxID=85968 RepID=A0A2G5P8V7_9MYCO|nr:hypothetical protein [Mycolicibacterium brumae]MCV7194131.1 hypothetical protein [Mycolicibacterium brumae]PIB74443.1 hypothetical protein CQY22_013320 [Mycolicibacterium brumae]RWA22696.1 hypothetical protein MBRU_12160 [Mycolicibacterium brumae DSM 44177]UWW07498.1 hypothetical protein L2Z93_000513 [Mycolicibacterium brumae]